MSGEKRFKLSENAKTALLTVISTLLTAFSTRVWQLNLLGILRGAGLCCFHLGVVTMIIGNWFEASRGAITGAWGAALSAFDAATSATTSSPSSAPRPLPRPR